MKIFLAGCLCLFGLGLPAQTTVTYTPTAADFANPERGFYRYSETYASSYAPLDAAQMASWRNAHTPPSAGYTVYSTLVFRYFVLDSYVGGTPLSASFLSSVQADFDAARTAGVKLIPRFAYTLTPSTGSCGNWICPPYGDADKATVLQHIGQLGPVLQANKDVIAAVQMGFIGTWGENYYTDHFGDASYAPFKLTDANWTDRNEVLSALLGAVPADRFVQVRYPQLKQRLVYGVSAPTSSAALTAGEAYSGSTKARLGFHNDCLLASADDYGTYFDYGNDATSAVSDTATLKPYFAADSRYAPVGGETCEAAYNPYNNCVADGGRADAELRRLHYSYLNAQYNNDVNNDWVGSCMADIQRYLGYRLVLGSGTYTTAAQPGQTLSINLSLTNEGYAAPFNPRELAFVLRGQNTGTTWRVTATDDPRLWLPGAHGITGTFCLPANMPTDSYTLLLHLSDPESGLRDRPEYAIRLANTDTWESSTGYNDLGHTLAVDGTAAAPACAGEPAFALVSGVLPVNFTVFTATPEADGIRLDWTTATELDNLGFGVERSTDGTSFAEIAFVDGAGDSNSPQVYSFTDETVSGDTVYYYRLAQTDTDGSVRYSPTVSAALLTGLQITPWQDRLRWSPNPATDRVRLHGIDGLDRVQLLDIHGRTVIRRERFSGTLELDALPAGVYLLAAERDGARTVRRLIVE